MWTTSIVVTSAIYAAALLDAVLIGVLVLQANGTSGKAGKLIGDRSKVCRAVCLGCVLSLTTAGGLLWRDFRGLNLFSRCGRLALNRRGQPRMHSRTLMPCTALK